MATVTKSIGTLSRDYSTITLWEADLDNGAIYSAGDDAQGECYNDSPFDESVTIDGGGTIGLNSVTLTVPVSERHDGTAGSGARIIYSSQGTVISVGATISTTISWLELKQTGTGNANKFNVSTAADNGITHNINNLLISGIAAGSQSFRNYYGIWTGGKSGSTRNAFDNIVYNISHASGGSPIGMNLSGAGTANSYNNTVFNVADAGGTLGTGINSSAASGDTQNSIAMDSGGSDFAGTPIGNEDHNLSSDATAAGTGSLTNKLSANQFVSNTDPYDLHLKTGADAIDAGVDLITTPTGVNIDIDGRDRDAQGDIWDMGADEFVAAAGGGRIMSSLVRAGGLAGAGGIAGKGGGLAG